MPVRKQKIPAIPRLKLMRDTSLATWYELEILNEVKKLGGFYNAHGHLCRAHTLEPRYLEHFSISPLAASNKSLPVKQELVGNLHEGPAYTEMDLRERMARTIERLIALGTTYLDTNVDATPDLPEGGLLAIRIALELKKRYRPLIEIRIAPTPIFGFKPDPKHKRSRWEVFEEAACLCDYLSLLPEKDDAWEPGGRIGFKQHVRKGLELARLLGKEAQFHVDQMNSPHECGTEWVMDVLDVLDRVPSGGKPPKVWVIHMISPSGYPEDRFVRLMDRLLEHNVGVIVCPTAALSMRQPRPLLGPAHNSIARIPDLIKRRIPIRVGGDNEEDVFVPQGNGDMLIEIIVGGVALRMNSPTVWAKLAAGHPLTNIDIESVGEMLHQDRKAFERLDPNWQPAIL
jgi:cytosine deaminase